MGFPFELWDHVVGFLKGEPLLACCLTCRRFNEHAGRRLKGLLSPTISLHDYTDINNLVEDIHTIPGRAQSIQILKLEGRPPLAFSLVSLRLAIQLVNLSILDILRFAAKPVIHSSTWSLYGHAFPGVKILGSRQASSLRAKTSCALSRHSVASRNW